MKSFQYNMPTKIIFGKDQHKNIGSYIKKFGKKVLLHHYGLDCFHELIEEIRQSLIKEAIDFVELTGIQPNPRLSLVHKGISICKEEKVDFILAVGGGSAIDSSKAIALGTLYDGDVWDFFTGKGIPETALPVGCVLTLAASGSEGSTSCVINNDTITIKRAINSEILRPKFSVLNPEITASVPRHLTNCGCIDIMAHVLEKYFTSEPNVELTDRLCEAVVKTVISNTYKVNADLHDYNARAELMWAGTLAHNGLLETGRIGDYASHHIAHQLSGIYDVIHGESVAIIMPAWMQYVYTKDIPRFAQYANRVWNIEMNYSDMESTARKGIEITKKFISDLGVAVSLKQIGIKKEDIPELVKKCIEASPSIGHFVELNENDIAKIYELALG